MQTLTKGLVASGQLEFINGALACARVLRARAHARLCPHARALRARLLPPLCLTHLPSRPPAGGWCMHDEASPGFADMIDQTTLGHRLILQQFNVTPKTTWQIDPFGHSTFQASMMSAPIAGFNGVHVARDDWQEQNQRTADRTIEMVWAPSTSLGMAGATYMGVLYNGYCTVGGIDMSEGSNDAPIMDDMALEDSNIGAVVDGVVNNALNDIKQYPQGEPGGDGTADVMLLLGCDFEFENAGTWYTNTDKLVHWLNQDGRVNAFYSTPSIYTAAKLETGKSYTAKVQDDFMPYADYKHKRVSSRPSRASGAAPSPTLRTHTPRSTRRRRTHAPPHPHRCGTLAFPPPPPPHLAATGAATSRRARRSRATPATPPRSSTPSARCRASPRRPRTWASPTRSTASSARSA